MKLSIIIPVYNEDKTLETLLKKILNLKINIDFEIIVVDDCSTDNSPDIIECFKNSKIISVKHEINKGKGAAIQTGMKYITGDIVIIQDADLEYDPEDYKFLIQPILTGSSKVVYGSRVLGKNRYLKNSFSSIFRVFANHVLTLLSNIINNQNLTDAHTCYKVFSIDVIKKINLVENGFAFCPEVTTKISNLKIPIKEIPISYNGRTYKDGKKIKFKDGILAIKALLKYKINK